MKLLSLICVLALVTGVFAEDQPVDLVICLDTSNSMDGLIDSAKQKLWDIVNELGRAKPKPHLRVGLYAYGTPGFGAETGYVKKLTDLTDDLDAVYGHLTGLRTDGGTEFVARVVRAAALEQSWSKDKNALKIIVVAGNEAALAGFAGSGVADLQQLVVDVREASDEVRALARTLRDQPASLLRESKERGVEIAP
jgi:hypothetical protein